MVLIRKRKEKIKIISENKSDSNTRGLISPLTILFIILEVNYYERASNNNKR